MKKRFFFSLLTVFAIIILSGCKKDKNKDDAGSSETIVTNFKATMDNSTYSASASDIIVSFASRQLVISAGDLSNIYCQIKVYPYITAGTFTFSNDGDLTTVSYHSPTIDLAGQSGTIIVSKDWQDTVAGKSKRYINGTFTVNAQTQSMPKVSKQITGSFSKIPLN